MKDKCLRKAKKSSCGLKPLSLTSSASPYPGPVSISYGPSLSFLPTCLALPASAPSSRSL